MRVLAAGLRTSSIPLWRVNYRRRRVNAVKLIVGVIAGALLRAARPARYSTSARPRRSRLRNDVARRKDRARARADKTRRHFSGHSGCGCCFWAIYGGRWTAGDRANGDASLGLFVFRMYACIIPVVWLLLICAAAGCAPFFQVYSRGGVRLSLLPRADERIGGFELSLRRLFGMVGFAWHASVYGRECA